MAQGVEHKDLEREGPRGGTRGLGRPPGSPTSQVEELGVQYDRGWGRSVTSRLGGVEGPYPGGGWVCKAVTRLTPCLFTH